MLQLGVAARTVGAYHRDHAIDGNELQQAAAATSGSNGAPGAFTVTVVAEEFSGLQQSPATSLQQAYNSHSEFP